MPRVMFRNAAVRAARNMKIVTHQEADGQFTATVAGQTVSATASTEQQAVRDLQAKVMDSAKTDNLSGFEQKVF